MTVEEAIAKVEQEWKAIAEQQLGYEIKFFQALEYPWGWHIIFLPADPDLPNLAEQYAVDRILDRSLHVGGKQPLEAAVQLFMKWRTQLGVAGPPAQEIAPGQDG